jgi:hypothetical protein
MNFDSKYAILVSSVLSICVLGRAMAHAVSHQPLTAEAQVRTQVSPRGLVVGKVALGQVLLSSSVFPSIYQYHSTLALHTHTHVHHLENEQ